MKRLAALVLVFAAALLAAGCNRTLIDTTYSYDYAYILLPNGVCVEGPVESWTDYADSDQLQVTIGDKVYLSDSTRIVLVKNK